MARSLLSAMTSDTLCTRKETALPARRPKAEAAKTLEVVTEVPDRAMVIFAHPDDAEIGSGGVVGRWVAAGGGVTYVLWTNGESGTADGSLTPTELARKRADEQRAAADFMGVKHVVMLGYPDGELEDTRQFLGDVVHALPKYGPHTVFASAPNHLHSPEHITGDGLEPHKVRELWYWGMDTPNVIVDVTSSIVRQ